MEGYCLYRFRKIGNVSSFYENGGGYFQKYNETVRKFHLHLFYSKLQIMLPTAHLYTLMSRIFEKNK